MPNKHHLLAKAKTDRVWTNLRQGRGTIPQQNMLCAIIRHTAFPLVKATLLFQRLYNPMGTSVQAITAARTEALREMLRTLDAMP